MASRYRNTYRFLTAQYQGPCFRCDVPIQPGDRIAWADGSSAHVECLTCRGCRRFCEEVNGDRHCPKCAAAAYRATPEGKAEARDRRRAGAAKAAETRRVNACQHTDVVSVPVGTPVSHVWCYCRGCERSRYTRPDGSYAEGLGRLADWTDNGIPAAFRAHVGTTLAV